ncbi:MAG: 2'-deoxycytidine 5'-triphosphate deaminase [Phycisphaerae bacterium]|nr:2'-deoxycytidine 5'-triphosphate deaminase [Phycisphaerae bacterium]
MSEPWKSWIPGVLSNEQLKDLCREGYIENVEGWEDDKKGPIDYSALDLTLTDEGYRMTTGSVKPFGDRFAPQIKTQGLVEQLCCDGDGAYVLKATQTYLFKLKEKLIFKESARLYGQATAKSTIGRMDVLARLIVDGADHYEGFHPDALSQSSGDMYIEITPMTFNVRVKAGIKLSQLRLFRGQPEDSEMQGKGAYEPILHGERDQEDGTLSVDLDPISISGHDACAFWANRMKENDKPIDLWEHKEGEKPSPCIYWKFRNADHHERIQVERTHFYIIRSKEKISLPGSVAIYCRASDETIGEMRIHYAGFIHPFFGQERQDHTDGTPLTFEVRGHDVNVSLKDGEKMAQLVFYRMSEPCTKKKEEEKKEPPLKRPVSYNDQTLLLSKIFAPWPERINVGEDGTVTNLTE